MDIDEEALVDWLYARYSETLSLWSRTGSPQMRAILYARMCSFSDTARFLISKQNGPVPLLEDRLLPFYEHQHIGNTKETP